MSFILLMTLSAALHAETAPAITTSNVIVRMSVEDCLKQKPARANGKQNSEASFHRLENKDDLPIASANGKISDIKTALTQTLQKCSKIAKSQVAIGSCKVDAQDWCQKSNSKLLELAEKSGNDIKKLQQLAKQEFDWFQLYGPEGKNDIQYTGYYSPTLEASRLPRSEYKIPLYKLPAEIVQIEENGKQVWRINKNGSFVPGAARQEIEDGALKGRNLELGYIKNTFDLLDFQIEGAGNLNMREPDGKIHSIFVNYAGANGQVSQRPAQVMRCMGLPRETWANNDGIRKYFAENPDQVAQITGYDKSYVFFKEEKVGPTGVKDIVLTPLVSLACDPKIIPFGFPSLYSTQEPESLENRKQVTHTRIGSCNDVGGAIKGQHFDVFEGKDQLARVRAERMDNRGTLFIPVPKNCGK